MQSYPFHSPAFLELAKESRKDSKFSGINNFNNLTAMQLTGDLDKMVALQRLLEPYGICEVRTEGFFFKLLKVHFADAP